MTVLGSFLLTGLVLTGFVYGIEFCQALSLVMVPMLIIFALSVWNAKRATAVSGEALRKILKSHRLIIQLLGMVSILISSMWGMYVNITAGVL